MEREKQNIPPTNIMPTGIMEVLQSLQNVSGKCCVHEIRSSFMI